MNRLGPWTVAYTHIVLLILICSPLTEGIAAFKLRRNSTLVSSRSVALSPQASVGVVRRLPSPIGRVGKLGRIRQRSTSTTTTETPAEETLTTTEEPPTFTYNVSVSDEDDIKRHGESSDALSVVWPVRARPAKRFRMPTPTTAEPQPLLKLLQPKPTRPAIYSLDGFVPRPSILRVVATEPPPHLNALAPPFPFGRAASTYSRRKASRRKLGDGDEDEDLGDELQSLGGRGRRRKKKPAVSRYTAFARKGVPGQDFPVYTFIPHTDFDCGPSPGLYADPYTDCQVWHMCPGGNLSPRHSFLCPNGTIFNQKKRICDWWYNVDCRRDVQLL